MIATAIGKPIAKAPTIAKVNSPSKATPGRTSSTDMLLTPTPRKSEAATGTKQGTVLKFVHCV